MNNYKTYARPKETFDIRLNIEYTTIFVENNNYSYKMESDIYYVKDKYGYEIPFDKNDFEENFIII